MNLQAPKGKVIVSVDLEGKNSHRFANGQTIRLERQYNNLNRRETEPVNATCLASDYIPVGAEVLIHFNACHAVNQLFSLGQLGGEQTASSVKYYSLSEGECFLWRTAEMEEWQPCRGFATALRVFEPYKGILEGIEPKKLPNTLLLTSGALKGKVCKTLHACDFEVIYQDRNGREGRVIRCRHFDGEPHEREEIVAVLDALGEKLKKGDLWVGLTPSDAKPLNQ